MAEDTFTPDGIRNQMLRIIQNARGGLPEITHNFRDMPANLDPSVVRGVYSHNVGPFGRIYISSQAGPSTKTHELTHATEWDLSKLYYDALNKKTPEARQFVGAFEKLKSQGANKAMANKLAPAWVAKEDPYRTSANELTAFAVATQWVAVTVTLNLGGVGFMSTQP